jgi:hypothetical protein
VITELDANVFVILVSWRTVFVMVIEFRLCDDDIEFPLCDMKLFSSLGLQINA